MIAVLSIGAPTWRKNHGFTSRIAKYLFSQIYHTWLGTISTSRSQEAWVTGKHSTRRVFSPKSPFEGQGWSGWQPGFANLLLGTPRSSWLQGKQVQFHHGFPKAQSQTCHGSEKIRVPNEKLFTVALALAASITTACYFYPVSML